MARAGEVLTPELPYEYLPGSAFAAATSFGSVSCGNKGWQTSRLGCVPIQAAVSKSFRGS